MSEKYSGASSNWRSLAAIFLLAVFCCPLAALAQAPGLNRGDVRPDDFEVIDITAPFTFNGITLVPEPETTANCSGKWRIGVLIPSIKARPSKERLLEIDRALEAFGIAAGSQCPDLTQVNYALGYTGYDNKAGALKKNNWQTGRLRWHTRTVERELDEQRRAALFAIPMPQAGTPHPLANRGFAYSVQLGKTSNWTMYAAWPRLDHFSVSQRAQNQVLVIEHDVERQPVMLEWRVDPYTNAIKIAGNFDKDIDQVCASRKIGNKCSKYKILHFAKGYAFPETREFDRQFITQDTAKIFKSPMLELFATGVTSRFSGPPDQWIYVADCWTVERPDLETCIRQANQNAQNPANVFTPEGRIIVNNEYFYRNITEKEGAQGQVRFDQFNLVKM